MLFKSSYKINKLVKFATVREDPDIIIPLIKKYNINNLLTICSGGCSALSYKAVYPQINISVFDTNIHQINLFKKKLRLLTSDNIPNRFKKIMQLNKKGVFEDIFTCFRTFINSFVTSHTQLKDNLIATDNINEYANSIFNNKYWQLAFEIFFSDQLLQTTFGKLAVQNSEKNSYGQYFKTCFEAGLLREDRHKNYFLHYALLGKYLANCKPIYMREQLLDNNIQTFCGTIWDIDNISSYDLIDLSNIFDWMSLEEASSILSFLAKNTKVNCLVIFRNLNNLHDYNNLIFKPFKKNYKLSQYMLDNSKDLFYSSITVLEKL